jgi:hypothetical protein
MWKLRTMKNTTFLFCIFSSLIALSSESTEITKLQYAENYKDIAIKQMQLYKIPASITLAQGILESGSGNSALAKKYNNHFGIKCHSDWSGEKAYFDDDTKNECFRAYSNAEDSYLDHSLFLTKHSRYKSLFLLNISDYKGWANGLKAAGYATSPNYANALINLIEEMQLNALDLKPIAFNPIKTNILTTEKCNHANHVMYITAVKGDSYYKISKRHNITLRQLHKYNEQFPTKDILEEGSIIYLGPRRNHSRTHKFVVLDQSMTLRELAQKEAVKLKPMMRKNQISSPDEQLPKGEKIILR